MIHGLALGALILLSGLQVATAQTQYGGWKYSALSMAGDGSFGGDFGNQSKEMAERLATDRCQKSAPPGTCSIMSVRYREGSQNVDWLVGTRCRDQVFMVTGPSRDGSLRGAWKLAYRAGFDPKVDCDLREGHLHTFPANSVFD